MRIRTHIGVSLDNFIAGPDGIPAWDHAPGWDHAASHGYPEFDAPNVAVIIGRNTFEQGHAYWAAEGDWPWDGKQVYVLTSRPLPERRPPAVHAPAGGPAGLVAALRDAGLAGDAQLLGGGQTIRALLELGAVDELGLVVLPIVLGGGVPLWTAGLTPRNVRLERQRAFPDGAAHLVYTAEQ
jgi:dihydrofolate reductase